MSKNVMIPSAAALLAALVAAAPMADAGDMTPQDITASRTTAQIAGVGYGHLGIPTTHQKGYFIAILQDSEGTDRFAVDAEMTLYLPTTEDPPLFKIGGIYGALRPLPAPGIHYILPLPPIGYVEGNWMLQPNNLGTFKLQVYLQQNEADKAVLGGFLDGNFQVVSGGFVHPPLGPPGPGAKSNLAASLVPQTASFGDAGNVGSANSGVFYINGSAMDAQRLRPLSAIEAGEAPRLFDFDDAGDLGTANSDVKTIHASNADTTRRRPSEDLARGPVGASGTGAPHASVDVPRINAAGADLQARRPSREIGAQSVPGVVILDGSAMDAQRLRPLSAIEAGEAPRLFDFDDAGDLGTANSKVKTIHASNADITQRRLAREIGMQGSLQRALITLDGGDVDVQRRRPASDLAAQAALGVADFDDIPGDEPALQMGRLRVRYVLFR